MKSYSILYFFAFTFLLAACLGIESESGEHPLKKAKNQAPKIDKNKIETLANRYLELGRFSGTIILAHGDSILFEKSYGLADYEANKPFTSKTAFKIGDLTEHYTEFLMQQLIKGKMLEPASQARKYVTSELYKDSTFTIDDLMKHKTGLARMSNLRPTSSNADTINNKAKEQGYNLLGQIINKVSGKSYNESLNLLDNLVYNTNKANLENTFYTAKAKGNEEAKGYVYQNYRGKGLELKRSPMYNEKEAFSSYGVKSSARDVAKIAWALPDSLIRRSGFIPNDGFSYALTKEKDLVVVVLSNRRHPVAKEIAAAVEAIYKGKEYRTPLPRKAVKIDPTIYKKYVGNYMMGPSNMFRVVMENDSLYAMLGPRKTTLYPQSENQFFIKEQDAGVRFNIGFHGKVTSLTLLNGFLDGQEITKQQ